MNDQYEGQGGSYAIDESGARVLIGRTGEPGQAPAAPLEPVTLADAIPQDHPEKAELHEAIDHSAELPSQL